MRATPGIKASSAGPGAAPKPGAASALAPWEALLTDAVGRAIAFWGFKANHGRVWALLYLRGQALDAQALRQTLGLSKGAMSMVTRELEAWGVVHRVRSAGDISDHFRAETELNTMIGRVIAERESKLVREVEEALAAALSQARAAQASPEALERLGRLTSLAHRMRLALETFLATSTLDVRSLAHILAGEASRRVRKLRLS